MSGWPDAARVRGDLALGAAPDTERTPWDDGAVRQERLYTERRFLREVVAVYDDSDHDEIEAWLDSYADIWWAWPDVDGHWRRARVVGGYAGVARRQVRDSAGMPVWELECQLEVQPAAIVAPLFLIDDAGNFLADDGGTRLTTDSAAFGA